MKVQFQVGKFANNQLDFDERRGFEGRQAHDFDKGRERIITTILVSVPVLRPVHLSLFRTNLLQC